jgi:hypothetical protein
VRGEVVLAAVCDGLDVERSNVVCIPRAIG